MKTMVNAMARGSKGAVLLLMVAFAVMDHAHGQNQTTYTSLYDALTKLPQYGTLRAAVDVANLTAALSNPNLTAILLAPDNQAFTATQTAFPGATALIANPPVVQAVLSYHVLPVTTANARLNLSNPAGTTLPSLLASTPQPGTLANVTFKSMPGNQYYLGGLPPGSLVNLSDSVAAGRGRIYTLTGGILIPPSKTLTLDPNATVSLTIAELVQNTPGFTNLTALVLADPVLTAFATNPDNAVTVFAPTDSAFAALFAQLNTTLDAVKNTSLVRRIVLNHIVPLRPFTSNQLVPPTSTDNTVPPLPTASPNDTLRVTVSGTPPTGAFVQGGGNTSPINVTAFNIPAGKSVAHVIDGVILPPAGPPGAAAPPNPPGAVAPPGIVTQPGALTPPSPPSTTPPGASAPPPPPIAASMTAASTWLLTTLLGAAMLLGFVSM